MRLTVTNRKSISDDLSIYDYLAKKGDFIEVTLPAEGICSIWITNLEAVETNVISEKEYDVSLISELKYYVESLF